ncbi:MAG: hypothetical protein M3N13_10060 [Candidatus Eremiobacteraeota bacterium]|nr:hypothetical protein [Candidatus Eremiobacteraeota bacterium]
MAVLVPALVLFSFSACGGGGSSGTGAATNALPSAGGGATMALRSALADTDIHAADPVVSDPVSVLKALDSQQTIGSTVDAKNGDQNPYGLDIARSTSGKFKTGDLVICNFNDKANVQGKGTTMEILHPTVGSTPTRLAQHPSLLGCAAIALGPSDDPWVASYSANENPIFSSSGQFITGLTQWPWWGPWGQAFATKGATGGPAFYESNATDGTIVRINISSSGNFSFDTIADGFGINHGQPGSILAPSGLQYDSKLDRLYIVDGMTNTVVAFNHAATIPTGGIHIGTDGKTFSGPFAKRGKVIFAGAPLNGPISSALLPNGNIVVGNTLDATGKNVMVELSSSGGHVLATRNVDKGVGAAIFGMVASGTNDANTKIYFNDDNDNTLRVLVH